MKGSMHRLKRYANCGLALVWLATMGPSLETVEGRQPAEAQIDLAERLAAKKLRVVNREATPLQGTRGIHLSERGGNGIAWIEGSEFSEGEIELEVRGRDVFQQSFVGVAFHRQNDDTYEAVYLRPFNFRATDPVRHMHAVQYIAVPDYDWPRLRKDFPEEFENPVDQSVDPSGWVRLHVVVEGERIRIFVGDVKSPALEVRKLGAYHRGLIGLWTGNGSDGDFANLRLTPKK
jgi:hypothetical protein